MSGRAAVAIGVPVYNGGTTLAAALDSLLAQDYENLRIVVSDNASTDETPTILARFAARDKRVRVQRVEVNRGAIWNFNRVFELAGTEYFCWSAHDDRRAPTFVSRCVELLEAHPEAALCQPEVAIIEANGETRIERAQLEALSSSPRVRFRDTLDGRPWPLASYGLFRSSLLAKTQLFRNYIGADLGLISEIALYGTIVHAREPLFTYRMSGETTLDAYFRRLQRTLDPARPYRPKQLVRLRMATEHLRSVLRAPLPATTRMVLAADIAAWCALSRGAVDELLRLTAAVLGEERFAALRAARRRLTRRSPS